MIEVLEKGEFLLLTEGRNSGAEPRDMVRDVSTENFRISKGFEYWANSSIPCKSYCVHQNFRAIELLPKDLLMYFWRGGYDVTAAVRLHGIRISE